MNKAFSNDEACSGKAWLCSPHTACEEMEDSFKEDYVLKLIAGKDFFPSLHLKDGNSESIVTEGIWRVMAFLSRV